MASINFSGLPEPTLRHHPAVSCTAVELPLQHLREEALRQFVAQALPRSYHLHVQVNTRGGLRAHELNDFTATLYLYYVSRGSWPSDHQDRWDQLFAGGLQQRVSGHGRCVRQVLCDCDHRLSSKTCPLDDHTVEERVSAALDNLRSDRYRHAPKALYDGRQRGVSGEPYLPQSVRYLF